MEKIAILKFLKKNCSIKIVFLVKDIIIFFLKDSHFGIFKLIKSFRLHLNFYAWQHIFIFISSNCSKTIKILSFTFKTNELTYGLSTAFDYYVSCVSILTVKKLIFVINVT
jgi:hypothetical protein